MPFLQFDGCCVRIALDWIVATNLSTLPHLPTVVVVVFLIIARRCRGPQLACLYPPFCRQSSACSTGDTVAGGPVYSSLSLLASVVGGSCCCQCQHGPGSQHWEVCAATPKLSLEVTSPNCPSVWQSECVGRSACGHWWSEGRKRFVVVSLQLSSAAWHYMWYGCSR